MVGRCRVWLFLLLMFGLAPFVTGDLTAQQQAPPEAAPATTRATIVLVPIFGAGDAGALLEGTLLIQRFTARGNEIAAEGTLSAALRDLNGGVRHVVAPISMPVDVDAAIASRSADLTVPQDSCEVLRVVLGTSTVNLAGATVALGSASFDLSAAVQPGAGVVTPPTSSGGTPSGTPATSTGGTTSIPSNGGTPSAGPTTPQPGQVGTEQPGVISPQPGDDDSDSEAGEPNDDATGQLPELLCSAANLQRTNGPRTELARVLNQALAALDR